MRTSPTLVVFGSLLVAAQTAAAAPTSMPIGGASGLDAIASLQFSPRALDGLNVAAAKLTSIGLVGPQISGPAGEYQSATIITLGTSLSYDDSTRQLLSLATTGGFRAEAGSVLGVTGGGYFEVKNLSIDFNAKRITGTVSGQTDTGSTVSYSGTLFTAPSLAYDPGLWQQGNYSLQMDGLQLNSDALSAMGAALEAKALMTAALQTAASNYGSMTIQVGTGPLGTQAPLFLPPAMAVAVPEPGTWVLMVAGFLGLGIVTRRKAHTKAGKAPTVTA